MPMPLVHILVIMIPSNKSEVQHQYSTKNINEHVAEELIYKMLSRPESINFLV